MAGLSRRAWLGAAGGLATASLAAPISGRAAAFGGAVQSAPIGRLSLNENSFGPSPRVAEAISRNLGDLHRYVEASEVERLVRQIAELEQVSPDQIVVGEILEALGAQLAAQRPGGGTFIYSTPGYTALIDGSKALGGEGVGIPLNARFENDLPALAAAIDQRTLAVSLVNPHNPSGTVDDQAAFDRFIREASSRTLVVVDEAYLEYDAFSQRSAIRFARDGANVLVFRTLAKIYGLAGLSIGYAVAPKALAQSLRAAGLGSPHSLNRLAVVAAEAALGDQAHVAEVARRSVAERDRLTATLDGLGLKHTDSRANFVFFESRLPAAEVRSALAARGIVVARAFPPLDEWIRITTGTEAETDQVVAALNALYA
jgi:histidinol-phosphate aminotransferase